MRRRISIFVAILSGVTALVGYFIPLTILHDVQAEMLRWAIYIGCLALIFGVINLCGVHFRRAFSSKPGWGWSILLVLSMVLTFVVVVYFGSTGQYTIWITQNIQIPMEASLAAVGLFVLLAGGARLLYRQPNLLSFVFLGTALLVILIAIPFPAEWESTKQLVLSIPLIVAGGGSRGILIGMALGAATVGLRILIGVDRPYER